MSALEDFLEAPVTFRHFFAGVGAYERLRAAAGSADAVSYRSSLRESAVAAENRYVKTLRLRWD
jgi:hypothetical protein